MPPYAQYISVQITDRRSSRALLIDIVVSPALEVLDREVNTWECLDSIAIDCLKPLVNLFGQASFLPEKLDHRSLLEFAHLTLKDAVNGSQTDRVDGQGEIEGNNQYHP
jgi:hypothetical protein